MPPYDRGRHEHGQNFLHDAAEQRAVIDLVTSTSGPIIEIGPGDGRLTERLHGLGRPLTVVEIDRRLAARLTGRFGGDVRVVNQDFLRYRLPETQHVVVGNVPFHQTTAILRRLLRAPGWSAAVLLVQWEVARRRAGVGGATLMTAQWSPWFSFELARRVPARSFTPTPGVDGGLLLVRRREPPLLHRRDRAAYQAMAHAVFTGRGRGFAEIATRAGLFARMSDARRWASDNGLDAAALPKHLATRQWVSLAVSTGVCGPAAP